MFSLILQDSVRKAKFTRVDPKDAADRKISFNDVAGLHEAKIEVMEFMDYLKDPKRYKVCLFSFFTKL